MQYLSLREVMGSRRTFFFFPIFFFSSVSGFGRNTSPRTSFDEGLVLCVTQWVNFLGDWACTMAMGRIGM